MAGRSAHLALNLLRGRLGVGINVSRCVLVPLDIALRVTLPVNRLKVTMVARCESSLLRYRRILEKNSFGCACVILIAEIVIFVYVGAWC